MRIGGVGPTLRFYDTLEVPVIENTADEEDLTFGMAAVGQSICLLDAGVGRADQKLG